MIIYFIQEEPDGPIKIGKTSNLVQRLNSLQVGCPRQLKVLYSFEVPNDRAEYSKKHIHECFRNRRLKGEWYAPCPYLYDYIHLIEGNGFFVDWQEEHAEYSSGDKFASLYNQIFRLVEETRAYGDIRRINDLANDLEELHKYAKTGTM